MVKENKKAFEKCSFLYLFNIQLKFKAGFILPNLAFNLMCYCTVGHPIWTVWKLHWFGIAVCVGQIRALSMNKCYAMAAGRAGAGPGEEPPGSHPRPWKIYPKTAGTRRQNIPTRGAGKGDISVRTWCWKCHFFRSIIITIIIILTWFISTSPPCPNFSLKENGVLFLVFYSGCSTRWTHFLPVSSVGVSSCPTLLNKTLCNSVCGALCEFWGWALRALPSIHNIIVAIGQSLFVLTAWENSRSQT